MTSPSHNSSDEDKTKQTSKVRAELPYLFEKELTAKQNKRIYVVDKFIATERATPIEGKFYSKFNDANSKDMVERQCYWAMAGNPRIKSRKKHGFPVLESQTYGWMPESISVMALRRINYIQAPKRRCAMTVYGEKFNCDRVTERPKFTGLRFYLR